MKVTNLTSRSVTLSDGTILAAAGHAGSSKEIERFSDLDRARLTDRGHVHVHEVEARPQTDDGGPKAVAGQQSPVAPKERSK